MSVTTSEPKSGARQILTDPYIGPLIVIILVFMAGVGLVFPVMALFARSFGVGNDGAGLFIATFGFARLFGDLIGGSIVDRRGERWTAVTGMFALSLCLVLTGAAPTFPVALIGLGLSGLVNAVVFASFFSYVLKAARADRVGRTLSFFYGAFNVGVIAGGAVGGWIAGRLGLASPFFGYAGVLMIAIVVYLRFVPRLPATQTTVQAPVVPEGEAMAPEAPAPSSHAIRDFLRLPGYRAALWLNLTYLWIVAAVFSTLLPLFAKDELGMTEAGIGLVFAVAVAAEFVVLFPAGSLSDRFGRRAVVIPSAIALAVMTVAVGFAPTPVWLAILFALLAFTSGFMGVPPAAMVSDVVPREQSGRAVGVFRFAGDLGFFVAPIVAGIASKTLGFGWAFAIAAAVPASAAVVAWLTPETMKRGGFQAHGGSPG